VARSFRLYEKKRGNRWTGSKRFGSLGEALFFAVFFLLGCAGLVFLLATQLIPEWRVNHAFVETACRVVEKDPRRARVEYSVGGALLQSWAAKTGSTTAIGTDRADGPGDLAEGSEHVCWYDPADPETVVLARGYTWWLWLTLSVPVSFLLIGGGGLVYTVVSLGKSVERRAASVKRSGRRESPEETESAAAAFPYVPSADQIADSPGTELAFRLPMAGSPAWTLGLWLAACLLWNGIVSLFAVVAVNGLWAGDPDWVLIVFLIPFLAIGIGLVVVFVRQLVLATAIGPTLLEISEQPLCPGRSFDLNLSQTGGLRIHWLEVLLACDEEATYRHGTNTRTESHRVYQQSVFRREQFDVQHGMPFTARFAAEVPAGAMHSFKSGHNEIHWKFVVRGRVAGWPGFQRAFPVIVRPNGLGVSKS
jgi:hypothetical protein